MGPVFQRVTTLAGAGTAQPLQTVPAWTHRFLAVDSAIEYTIACDAPDGTYNIALGAVLEVQESAISGGATIGVFPAFQDNVKTIAGFAGDEVAVTLTLLGADTVMLEIHLTALDDQF